MACSIRTSTIVWVPFLAVGLAAQDAAVGPGEINKAVDDLQRISNELNRTLKLLDTHLDDFIAHYDSSYRAGRLQVQGADCDVGSGESNGGHAAVRKLVLARMLAARSLEYNPAPLADSSRLQDLIVEARKRIDASDGVIRRMPVISVKSLGRREEAEWKSKHDQLLKARTAAEEAARQAILALPVDLPEAASPEEAKDRAFELIVTGRVRLEKSAGQPVSPAAIANGPSLPIRWERNKRITLIREPGDRMMLTDPGTEDRKGRHLFYQEEWVQSGVMAVKILRWRVAVDTATGRHILIKRYPPRKLRGDIENASSLWDQDYLWRLEPPEDSTEPSRVEVESALSELGRDREQLHAAIQDYREAIRNALAHNDRLQAAENQAVPDAALAQELREKLFAIRGHLARAPAILEHEKRVGGAIDHLAESVQKLESLAAWANRATLDEPEPPTKSSASGWETLQQRSDDEIEMVIRIRAEASATLPPDLSPSEAKFPALQRGAIVHIIRQPSRGSTFRCLQEIWRFGFAGRGGRRVERIATLIAIDSMSGIQKVLGTGTRYYSADRDDSLEEVFDQYAAQDVPIASIQP
jgi:hypothetical protein